MAVPPPPAARPTLGPGFGGVHLVPSRWLVLFLVVRPDLATTLAVRPADFMDGVRAVRSLCGFGGLVRCEDALDELLPWAGNV